MAKSKEKYSKQDLIRLIEWFDNYDGRNYLSYLIVEDFLKDLRKMHKIANEEV